MSAFIQGQYSFTELYAKEGRVWYCPVNIPEPSNGTLNLQAFASVRLTASYNANTNAINITTNANQISVVNTNAIQINANATVMNVDAGYYSFDIDGLSTRGWEPVCSGTLRIDSAS
jgi:hypothetical protein